MNGMLESPWLVPVPIPTPADNWFRRVWALFATRYFCLGKDWYYINSAGVPCVIPGAFNDDGSLKEHYYVTDGKSYPRIFRPFMSSLGIGITEGLVHDFGYRYRCQILANGGITRSGMPKRECDIELREVGIRTNNLPIASYFSYYVLRLFGDPAWNHHRDNDDSPSNSVHKILVGFMPRDPLTEKPVMKPFLA